jgi:nucleotide-binding universal stress UspA family protein
MYNKILVPLDGSELAECVLEHVRAIATGCRVPEVVLLTIVEQYEEGPAGITWGGVVSAEQVAAVAEKSQAEATDYITKVADKLKEEGMAVQTLVIQGTAADGILDYAQKNQADLILMSTHGRSRPSRWAFGSVADRVIRHSPIPVLIVPPKGCRISW